MAHNFENAGVEDLHSKKNKRSKLDKLGYLWCALMHDALSWPMHGHYTCRSCGRRYPVGWEGKVGISALDCIGNTAGSFGP